MDVTVNANAETCTDKEALQNLLLDIECLDTLLPWTVKFNLFDVLKISRTEIRHSNMLSWLLNPNENHGFGDLFIKGIAQRLVQNDTDGRYDVFKFLLLDFFSFSVYREWKNIDILLVSNQEKTLIAIENKVGSHEHSNQLSRYRTILEKEYPDYQNICVFLTPDGEDPSDVENWDVLTYRDIVDILENICKRIELQPDVKLMINNYTEIVRREIVEDQQLIDICNKIYSKHRKALDLIFEHRLDGRSQISDVVRNTLNELSVSGKIVFDEKINNGSYLRFQTEQMDKLFPPLNDNSSSWGTNRIYYYWVYLEDNRFCACFELGGWNVPEDQMNTVQKLIDINKPSDKKRTNFQYKRLYRTKWYNVDNTDNIEDDTKKHVIHAINDLKQWESKTIAEL